MCRILAVANVKGGVGKTTTAVNLSASLAERGRKVLAVDLDPQSSLTVSLGFDPDQVNLTIRDLLDKETETINSAILATPEDWDLIPTNSGLRALERELESEAKRIYAVGAVLQKLRKRYDYILLDCPANAGALTGAALAAADEVVIPLTPDFLGFRVLGSLILIIKEMQKRINPKLRIAGIFLTMYESRTRHARDILTSLHNSYASEIPFFSAIIHQSVRLKEAPSVGKSIIKYAPRSQAAQAYRVIAGEIDEGIHGALEVDLATMVAGLAEATEATTGSRDYASFCRATEIESGSPEAWMGRAETAPRWDEAIRCFASALRLDPSNTEIRSALERGLEEKLLNCTFAESNDLMGLAQNLSDEGYPHYAECLYRRVTELDPGHAEAWLARARTTDNPTERVAFAQRGLEIQPNHRGALEATDSAKQALKDEARRLVEQGTGLVQAGSMTEAQLQFKRAIELDPLNDSAWLGCAHSAENLPAKLSSVKQALDINPRNPEARDLYRIMTSFMGGTERGNQSLMSPGLRRISLGVLMLILVSVFLLTAFKVH
jgi:chromosome partitioning protein